MAKLLPIPSHDAWRNSLDKRIQALRQKAKKGSRQNDLLTCWIKTGLLFDRSRVGRFVGIAQATKQLNNKELADYLNYGGGSNISHAITHGSISSDRFHRLLVDCFKDFEQIDPCEAPTAAFMFVITQLKDLERNVTKRHFSRDVYTWFEQLLVSDKLLDYLIENQDSAANQELFHATADTVREQLKGKLVQSVKQRKNGEYPNFILRTLRTKDNVTATWKDVQKMIWEWQPCFFVMEEIIKECQPS